MNSSSLSNNNEVCMQSCNRVSDWMPSSTQPEPNFTMNAYNAQTDVWNRYERSANNVNSLEAAINILQNNYDPVFKRIKLESSNPITQQFIKAVKECNHVNLINLLQTHGTVIKDEEQLSPLKIAILLGNFAAVKTILKFNEYVLDNTSDFALACEQSLSYNEYYDIIVEFAKCQNFDVNKVGGTINETPLYLLMRNGKLNEFKFLLTFNNVNVNVKTNSGVSLFLFALNNYNVRFVDLLLNYSGLKLSEDEVNAIFYSSDNSLISKLLSLSGKFDLKESTKAKEHFFALTKNPITSVDILQKFETVVDFNSKDDLDCTPLTYAMQNNDINKLKYFLSKNVDIVYTDHNDMNPLMNAITDNNNEIAKILLNSIKNYDDSIKNKLRDQCNKSNENVLILAAKNNNNEILKLTYETFKVNVNHQDGNGYTALYYTVDKQNVTNLNILLNDPLIDINVQDTNGNTILMDCISKNNFDLAYLLLKNKNKNIDMNIKNNYGQNVLLLCLNRLNSKCDQKNTDVYQTIGKVPKFSPHDPDGFDDMSNLAEYPGCHSDEIMVRMFNSVSHTRSTNSYQGIIPYKQVPMNDFTPCASIKTKTKTLNDIVNIISTTNSDLNLFDIYNKSPLAYLIENKDHKLFSNFINLDNINLNLKNNDGKTYLMTLFDKLIETKLDSTYLTMFLQLFNHSKINLNETDYLGNTILNVIAGCKDIFILDQLLKNKTLDINKANYKNVTPLVNAVRNELWNNVKLLLVNGSDQNVAKERLFNEETLYKFNNLATQCKTNKDAKKGWLF